SFRVAHGTVAKLLRQHKTDETKALIGPDLQEEFAVLDPKAVVQAAKHGGGPAPEAMAAAFARLVADYQSQKRSVWQLSRKWIASRRALDQVVAAFLSAS